MVGLSSVLTESFHSQRFPIVSNPWNLRRNSIGPYAPTWHHHITSLSATWLARRSPLRDVPRVCVGPAAAPLVFSGPRPVTHGLVVNHFQPECLPESTVEMAVISMLGMRQTPRRRSCDRPKNIELLLPLATPYKGVLDLLPKIRVYEHGTAEGALPVKCPQRFFCCNSNL